MPRYFFDTSIGDRVMHDEEGAEFDGIDTIRVEAVAALTEMARDVLADGRPGSLSIRVLDEVGATLLILTLSLAAEPLPDIRPAVLP